MSNKSENEQLELSSGNIIMIQRVINKWRNSPRHDTEIILNGYMRQIENIIKPYDFEQPIVHTKSLGSKATESLLTKLRPFVYANGAASNDSHSDYEVISIGKILLDWWTEFNIDDSDKEITE